MLLLFLHQIENVVKLEPNIIGFGTSRVYNKIQNTYPVVPTEAESKERKEWRGESMQDKEGIHLKIYSIR